MAFSAKTTFPSSVPGFPIAAVSSSARPCPRNFSAAAFMFPQSPLNAPPNRPYGHTSPPAFEHRTIFISSALSSFGHGIQGYFVLPHGILSQSAGSPRITHLDYRMSFVPYTAPPQSSGGILVVLPRLYSNPQQKCVYVLCYWEDSSPGSIYITPSTFVPNNCILEC